MKNIKKNDINWKLTFDYIRVKEDYFETNFDLHKGKDSIYNNSLKKKPTFYQMSLHNPFLYEDLKCL